MIIVGLGLFVYFGDPAGGKENAPNDEWAIAIAALAALSAVLLVFGSRGGLSMKAAVYGTVAGVMFGLSSALTKPTLDYLHESVEHHALPLGVLRARDRRGAAASCCSRSRSERGAWRPRWRRCRWRTRSSGSCSGSSSWTNGLSRPAWHVVLAVIGLGLALVGAVVISLAREATKDGQAVPDVADGSAAMA